MNSIINVLSEQFPKVPVTSVDGELIQVDWGKMTDETIAALAWHGLKQKANDPNGAKGLSDTAKVGNSRKVVDKAENNSLDVRERASDPVGRELTRLATEKANEHFRAKGYKVAKIPADEWKAVMAKLRSHPALIKLAEQRAAETAELSIDL